ncbi:MAG TPA: hypothetical protein VF981_04340 [Gemmatimonadaceae bacterium]
MLPLKRAEELLQTLPGVIAARIIASETGAVDEIHVLTSAEVTPKQTVRNIESALIAHLGMRVDHRKISVATTLDQRKPGEVPVGPAAAVSGGAVPTAAPVSGNPVPGAGVSAASAAGAQRALYFEDVEVRRSRAKGITCRVTLRKGDQSYTGEAEGMENERSRLELAGRAALKAIAESDEVARQLDLAGARLMETFDRAFVFVAVTALLARETAVLAGTCEVKESPETACVLAVLDATNRWLSNTSRS